jgi:hypothetical protein
MDRFKKFCQLALPALALMTFCNIASAQEFTQGDKEAVFYGGGIFSGNLGTFGGGFGYAVRPQIEVLGELGFVFHSHGVRGFELHGDVAYLFPLKPYPKFTPYVIGGIGIFHTGVDGISGTTGGVDLGGGARMGIGKNWGIRPEVKFTAGNHFDTRISGGIYYDFGK